MSALRGSRRPSGHSRSRGGRSAGRGPTGAVSFISRSAAVDVLGPVRGAVATVIYNALPAASGDLDLRPSRPATRAELLYVGSLSTRKRLQLLPFVLERVRRALPATRLRVIGVEPDAVADVVQACRQLGQLDAMIWEGRMRSGEIAAYYRASDVLLVPSAYEGLPMVILEALRWGLPCVATRVGGHPEVIEHGVNGFLVDPDNPDQMAERCIQMLQDPELRRRMGNAGAALVAREFNVAAQVEQYVRLYRRMAGGTP